MHSRRMQLGKKNCFIRATTTFSQVTQFLLVCIFSCQKSSRTFMPNTNAFSNHYNKKRPTLHCKAYVDKRTHKKLPQYKNFHKRWWSTIVTLYRWFLQSMQHDFIWHKARVSSMALKAGAQHMIFDCLHRNKLYLTIFQNYTSRRFPLLTFHFPVWSLPRQTEQNSFVFTTRMGLLRPGLL